MEFLSLIISVLLGVPGLIMYFQNRKTTLFYLQEKQINLQEDLLANFNNLKITYDNIEVTNKIYYTKGSIICNGSKDLTNENNQIQISVDKSIWLNFKITNISKGLSISVENKNEKILLSFNLMKNQEFFEFEGLLECNDEISKPKIDLKFFHRIPNIPNIKLIDSSYLKAASTSVYLSLFVVFCGIIGIFFLTRVDSYDLTSYDYKTNKEVKYTDVYFSKSYKKAELDVIENYYGIELIFGRSKKYEIKYDQIKKTSSIYFRKDYGFVDYLLFVFCTLYLLYGIITLYYNIVALSQRKFIKVLSTTT